MVSIKNHKIAGKIQDIWKGELKELRQMAGMESGQKDIQDIQTTNLYEIQVFRY